VQIGVAQASFFWLTFTFFLQLGQGQRNVQAFSPASPGGKHPINVLWEHAATSQRGQGKLGEKVPSTTWSNVGIRNFKVLHFEAL